MMNLDALQDALPDLRDGLLLTIFMWLAGSALSPLLGLVVALARRFGPAWVDRPLWAIVEVIRGTPFLVQMFLLYYGGPFIGLDFDPTTAGLVGLTVYGAAYFSEILRGGLIAVPKGHVEAALCVGLGRMQIIRRILLPEMTLLVLPASVNMFVVLLKETAVLSIITVPELTMAVTGFGSANFAFTQAALVLAVCYWGLTEMTGRLGRLLERRLDRFRLA
jgi:polar amino acid transport system permease protein